MKPNALKPKLRAGQPVFGTLTPVHDPAIVDMVGILGFDLYMLDCEHGPAGPMQAEQVARACEAAGITPLVRIRSTDPKLVLQFMDVGMMGVMMPGITSADDVKRLVDAVKYPPVGMRGIGPVRANDYLAGSISQADFIQLSNDETMVLPQIELVAAVQNLDSLLRVEGIDGFIVGPRDLSMSMGFRDGPAHDEVRSQVREIFDAVRAAGLVVGITASTRQEAQGWIDMGAQIILGSVNGLLKLGAQAYLR